MPEIEKIEEENSSQRPADRSQITSSKEDVNENILPTGQAGSQEPTIETTLRTFASILSRPATKFHKIIFHIHFKRK